MPPFRPPLSRASTFDRIEATITAASQTLAATALNLERVRRRRQGGAGLEAIAGTLGVIGFIDVVEYAHAHSVILTGLLACSCAIPIFASVQRAIIPDAEEFNLIAATEQARALIAQAGEMRDVIRQAPPSEGSEIGVKQVLNAVVSQIEQSAAGMRGREDRRAAQINLQSRRHIRIKPVNSSIVVTRSDELMMMAELVDVSISGAAISGDLPGLRVGDTIMLGSKAARVVRATADGWGCEFVVPLDPLNLDFDIVL